MPNYTLCQADNELRSRQSFAKGEKTHQISRKISTGLNQRKSHWKSLREHESFGPNESGSMSEL